MPCEEYILQDEYDYFFNSLAGDLRRVNGKTRMQKNGKTAVWPICATVRRK